MTESCGKKISDGGGERAPRSRSPDALDDGKSLVHLVARVFFNDVGGYAGASESSGAANADGAWFMR